MTIVGASSPFEAPAVDDDELREVEQAIQRAQRDRSVDHLHVLGLGEISVAVGWPTETPRFVAKRLLPLADSFRGRSAEAFDARIEEWQTSAKDLLEALDSLGQFLNGAADSIEQTDQQIAEQLG